MPNTAAEFRPATKEEAAEQSLAPVSIHTALLPHLWRRMARHPPLVTILFLLITPQIDASAQGTTLSPGSAQDATSTFDGVSVRCGHWIDDRCMVPAFYLPSHDTHGAHCTPAPDPNRDLSLCCCLC